ncbi:hypothetical protein P7C73_g1751, partial [Tremellales sp. Uapishka_1]
MPYGPQRRHAVASLQTTTFVVGLLQHFYSPNILVFVARILAQIQITAPAIIHPNRSLFTLFFMLTMMNVSAVFLHFIDLIEGSSGGKSLILDFVGQANPTSMTRVLLLDLLLYTLQCTSLVVAYISTHKSTIPASSTFAFDDLLLPPSPTVEFNKDENVDEDIETGRGGRRRTRRQSVRADEADEVWLDDDDDDGPSFQACWFHSTPTVVYHTDEINAASSRTPLLSSRTSPPTPRPSRDIPLIFSLPFSHLVNLVFYLPSPTPPPGVTSGGTPATSPPQDVQAPLPRVDIEEDEPQSTASTEPNEVGRIPGEYSPGLGRDNGG